MKFFAEIITAWKPLIIYAKSFILDVSQDSENALALHRVKSIQIRSYFWSVFSCIRSEYGDLRSKSPYSVRIQEYTDQK